MDPNFSLSVHLRSEMAKATEITKQQKKETKRKREEWLSMGAPAQADYVLFLEEREHEKKKRLKQEQKMFEKREKEVKKLKKEKKKFQKKLKKKLHLDEDHGPVHLSDWKKGKSRGEVINENKNSESEDGSDIEWGKPPPPDYKKVEGPVAVGPQNFVHPFGFPIMQGIPMPFSLPFLPQTANPFINNLSQFNAMTANNMYINNINIMNNFNRISGVASAANLNIEPSSILASNKNKSEAITKNAQLTAFCNKKEIQPDVCAKIQAAKALAASLNNP